jgi:hypothetical protein
VLLVCGFAKKLPTQKLASMTLPAELLHRTAALDAAVKTIEATLKKRDAADELAAWPLQSIRLLRGGVQSAVQRLAREERRFTTESLEQYSDEELRAMLEEVRCASHRLATLRAAIFYDADVTATKPDRSGHHRPPYHPS